MSQSPQAGSADDANVRFPPRGEERGAPDSHIVKVLESDHVRLRNEDVHFQVMEYVDDRPSTDVEAEAGFHRRRPGHRNPK
jgi:hypothetical protein